MIGLSLMKNRKIATFPIITIRRDKTSILNLTMIIGKKESEYCYSIRFFCMLKDNARILIYDNHLLSQIYIDG